MRINISKATWERRLKFFFETLFGNNFQQETRIYAYLLYFNSYQTFEFSQFALDT